jgi:excinuclease ABC subunit C
VNREQLKSKLQFVPDKPGVYLMKGAGGEVLYVGKAALLKVRLAAYFQRSSAFTPRLESLLDAIADFEYLVTDSELEAFMLESVLIKKHRPRYNVILKDDKQYPYLKLTVKEKYPRLAIVRRVEKDGSLYFGPYVPTKALRQTLRLLYSIFPLRHCISMKPKQGRPCINYQIHRCSAPCYGLISQSEYTQIVEGVKLFLKGKNEELVKLLKQRMDEASTKLDYERAAGIRDQLLSIKKVIERQKIISSEKQLNQDVIAMAQAGDVACFQVFFIRHGLLISHKSLFLEQAGQVTQEDLIDNFLLQFYAEQQRLPSNIIIPRVIADQPLMEEWLGQLRGGKVKLIVPHRGEKYHLLAMAQENARLQLEGYLRQQAATPAVLVQAKQDLGLGHLPRRVEAFDISNMQGEIAVGSMIVWEEGGFRKNDYRRFNIKRVSQADDCAMLAESISRRYSRLVKEGQNQPPDLILVDGGKGQLNTAIRVLKEIGLDYIPVLGLAKREEDVFLPGQKTPLKLPEHSSTRRWLQRIRDEAHRFAISFHRQQRSRKIRTSVLTDIPGVGSKNKEALLRYFGSLKKIKEASFNELENLAFLQKRTARKIFDFFHPEH